MSDGYFDTSGYLHCMNSEMCQNLFKKVGGKTAFEKLVDGTGSEPLSGGKTRYTHDNKRPINSVEQRNRADDFAKSLNKIRWGTIT